jgi:tetratricopeptide (TPR) repeat protein
VPSFAPGAPWYRLGQSYEQLGMPDSARRCFERALQVNPQLVPARLSLDSLTHH